MKSIMRYSALVAVASALNADQLRRLKEVNNLRKEGAFNDAEYNAHKAAIVGETAVEAGENTEGRRRLASTMCLADLVNKGLDQKSASSCASDTVKNIRGANNAAVNSVLSYIQRSTPTANLKVQGRRRAKDGVECKWEHECNCANGTGTGNKIMQATCNQDACFNEWYVFDNARELKCQAAKCDPDRDNYQCCRPGRWLDTGTYIKKSDNDATVTHTRQGDWDSARASPWVTTGKISVVLKVKVMKTYMMIGAIRRDGVQWNNHVHSSKVGDSHPDGWVWYSAGNTFYNYVPLSGSFKRWGGPNVFRTNNLVRVYIDADNRQVFIYCNGTQVASWSNCAWGQGVSVGTSMYDNGSALTIMTQNPGNDAGYGAWREWGSMLVRNKYSIKQTANGNWETARAAPWMSSGSYTVTFKATKFANYVMMGCFRKDYMNYEQHMHGSAPGDIYPDGWVWYSAGNAFYNYVPFGGSFKRVSTAASRVKTGEYIRIRADASGRACYISWRKAASGPFTLIAQWTNLNIGRGMTIGMSLYNVNDEFTIVEEGQRNGSQERSACGTDACLNGWTPHDNAAEIFCKGSSCSPDKDNYTCCHIGRWLDKGTYLKTPTSENIIVHTRNGDWDSARASAWITTGRQQVTLKVRLMKSHMMIGAIRKDGVQWNNHVHSSKVGDSHPDGWVWYSAGNTFYNYVPLSGSFKRWGGPNVFRTNNLIRVYVDADKKQVFIFCNGTQVASWSNCAWGQGVSVGASFHDVDSSLEIIQNTPMNDKGFGGWREWGMLMVREGGTIYSRYNSGWETARATEWITKGSKTVTLKMVKFTRYGMAGCYRRDFMIYEQHPHSGNVGDIHPEGWVWYSANGGFSNYSPYGGSFKRVSTKTNRWLTNHNLRIKADASARGCYVSWRAGSSGSFTLIAQWTNLNIGKGMSIGYSTHDVNDGVAIVESNN